MSEAPRPPFIAHYRDKLAPLDHGGFPDMGGFAAPLGASLGLTRIGINYEITPPGSRTSFPPAEREEEEFVFVLRGTPDVWIDGILYELNEGDAVAFPSGTGIAHCFLNNSDADVHLLIVGEHLRPGNQLFYPLNPERMTMFAEWNGAWTTAPHRPLGPHDGKARAGTRKGPQTSQSAPSSPRKRNPGTPDPSPSPAPPPPPPSSRRKTGPIEPQRKRMLASLLSQG